MALPEIIEIAPFDKPVRAEITVPGSKSITNRALILAALGGGETILTGALWSEDTQIMVECLRELGFMMNMDPDPKEPCNRTITVYGKGGEVPPGGTDSQPMELYVGNAGTAARFLGALVCLGKGVYRLSGTPRMHERPQGGLFGALGELGYRVEPENGTDHLPARIFAEPRYVGDSGALSRRFCRVDIHESSQFASALLMCAPHGNWKVEMAGESSEESPYIAMTSELMKIFPNDGGTFAIEPDASSASYFWAAGALAPPSRLLKSGQPEAALRCVEFIENASHIAVPGLPSSPGNKGEFRMQIDEDFLRFAESWPHRHEISRKTDLGDSVMTAIVLAPFADEAMTFTGLGKLRHQECERVAALRTELTKCGAKVVEKGDTLTIHPSKPEELHGAEIETYNDHRMAMCFAVLGLKVAGMKIKNPACVKKTFPNFFQKIAAAPPRGLGLAIWEVQNGGRARKLAGGDLFAD